MEKPPASASTTAAATTFVHADATTFKELVQRLTGPPESTTTASAAHSRPSSSFPVGRLKRHHHGSHLRLVIPKPAASLGLTKPASPAVPSPVASFARLDISAEEKSAEVIKEKEEEERAIKERRFYLYPSPRERNRVAEPELLLLFPLTSPRAAAGDP